MLHPRRAALVALVLIGFVTLVGGVTWVALESGEVAVLRTRDPDGPVHETRVWIADEAGFAWLEAATPEREWYVRLLRDPRGEIVRSGTVQAFRAVPEPGDNGHLKIRRLLREKYGWRDWWVGWFQDTSRSVAVRLNFGSRAAVTDIRAG